MSHYSQQNPWLNSAPSGSGQQSQGTASLTGSRVQPSFQTPSASAGPAKDRRSDMRLSSLVDSNQASPLQAQTRPQFISRPSSGPSSGTGVRSGLQTQGTTPSRSFDRSEISAAYIALGLPPPPDGPNRPRGHPMSIDSGAHAVSEQRQQTLQNQRDRHDPHAIRPSPQPGPSIYRPPQAFTSSPTGSSTTPSFQHALDSHSKITQRSSPTLHRLQPQTRPAQNGVPSPRSQHSDYSESSPMRSVGSSGIRSNPRDVVKEKKDVDSHPSVSSQQQYYAPAGTKPSHTRLRAGEIEAEFLRHRQSQGEELLRTGSRDTPERPASGSSTDTGRGAVSHGQRQPDNSAQQLRRPWDPWYLGSLVQAQGQDQPSPQQQGQDRVGQQPQAPNQPRYLRQSSSNGSSQHQISPSVAHLSNRHIAFGSASWTLSVSPQTQQQKILDSDNSSAMPTAESRPPSTPNDTQLLHTTRNPAPSSKQLPSSSTKDSIPIEGLTGRMSKASKGRTNLQWTAAFDPNSISQSAAKPKRQRTKKDVEVQQLDPALFDPRLTTSAAGYDDSDYRPEPHRPEPQSTGSRPLGQDVPQKTQISQSTNPDMHRGPTSLPAIFQLGALTGPNSEASMRHHVQTQKAGSESVKDATDALIALSTPRVKQVHAKRAQDSEAVRLQVPLKRVNSQPGLRPSHEMQRQVLPKEVAPPESEPNKLRKDLAAPIASHESFHVEETYENPAVGSSSKSTSKPGVKTNSRSARTPVPNPVDDIRINSDDEDDYEALRAARIRENQKMLIALGLAEHAPVGVATRRSPLEHDVRRPRGRPPNPNSRHKRPRRVSPDGTTRDRPLAGERQRLACVEIIPLKSERLLDSFPYLELPQEPDFPQEDDQRNLKSLSVDWSGPAPYGIDANGIPYEKYSDINGDTCHQCKRRTDRPKMECRNQEPICKSKYCSTCVRTRYKFPFEEEARSFICPKCEGFCNCSNCLKNNQLLQLFKENSDTRARIKESNGDQSVQAYLDSIGVVRVIPSERQIHSVRFVNKTEDTVSLPIDPGVWALIAPRRKHFARKRKAPIGFTQDATGNTEAAEHTLTKAPKQRKSRGTSQTEAQDSGLDPSKALVHPKSHRTGSQKTAGAKKIRLVGQGIEQKETEDHPSQPVSTPKLVDSDGDTIDGMEDVELGDNMALDQIAGHVPQLRRESDEFLENRHMNPPATSVTYNPARNGHSGDQADSFSFSSPSKDRCTTAPNFAGGKTHSSGQASVGDNATGHPNHTSPSDSDAFPGDSTRVDNQGSYGHRPLFPVRSGSHMSFHQTSQHYTFNADGIMSARTKETHGYYDGV